MARATRIRTLLISVDEAADALEVSPQTIRNMVASGSWIGSQYVGGKYVISRAAFNRLYDDGVWHSDETPRNPLIQSFTPRRQAS